MPTPPRTSRSRPSSPCAPPRTRHAGGARRLARAAAGLALLGAVGCEGTTSALGPDGAQLTATTGTAGTVGGRTGAAVVGRWTRVDAASPGVVVETTFAFLDGGQGVRTIVTRTALGGVVAVDRQAFAWTGGGGVLVLRFPGPVGDTIVRAAFSVETELAGTTLRLDGVAYRRASG